MKPIKIQQVRQKLLPNRHKILKKVIKRPKNKHPNLINLMPRMMQIHKTLKLTKRTSKKKNQLKNNLMNLVDPHSHQIRKID